MIKKLVSFAPRQLAGETAAREWVVSYLRERGIPFVSEPFTVPLPRAERVSVTADGKNIPALNCGLVSGSFRGAHHLVNALQGSDDPGHQGAFISFNPLCRTISQHTFYNAPAVAVSARSVPTLLRARDVRVTTRVRRVSHRTANILVGNRRNPRVVVFTHLDSNGTGAADNASGVAATLRALERHSLDTTLFVISGDEELSYDWPTYWGFGYRQFEHRHRALLERARFILLIDGVGLAPPQQFGAGHPDLPLGLPLANLQRWAEKCVMVGVSDEVLMPVYHSDDDLPSLIQSRYLAQADRLVDRLIIQHVK